MTKKKQGDAHDNGSLKAKSGKTRVVKEIKSKPSAKSDRAISRKTSDVLPIALSDLKAEKPSQNGKSTLFIDPPDLDPRELFDFTSPAVKNKPIKAKPERKTAAVRVKKSKVKKIFVLDTSVILYNHNSINSFDDNDVAIPITVLEELDNFKKGNDNKNFEAREFIRILDSLSENATLTDWIPLVKSKGGNFKVVMNEQSDRDARLIFDDNKPDHRILNAALSLVKEFPDRKVILVSKDINLRLKAKSLDLTAEDFLTGKIKDVEGLYTGITTINDLSSRIIDKLYQNGYCTLRDIGVKVAVPNHYYILRNTTTSALAFYNALNGRVERIEKRSSYRITPRNAEQVFAMHAILNPEVKLVTLQGVAGTGKTLLALATALEQKRNFKQVFLARPIVPLSNKDIGYLPGDIKSKINPYMEPLYDNLKFIQSQFGEKDKEFKGITDALESEKLVIQPLAYIRGRSISNVCFIIDEAQNLTPHEVKTIITRAGQGTKIILTGDIYQIDTPYLDAQSNGMSYLIDKVKHHAIYAHVRLEKGERSELANLANDLL
ncbi:MAG: PhoH family protein [Lentimicrobium sp.]|jgi:PhoH-like ATPase|nr:PhoH family protein [Lentimicrobium sp.]MDD2527405.1 PhoH family protein [Lentimicrobiaceae bacterium]MDD4597595.1 PhoH family protein [Lentimicrobiaceae bacterium]MDY0026209.1 PhoH family protein [Lentimicrobium sp.]HAH56916.1 ribonuclease [Bacteroidales bacterium]